MGKASQSQFKLLISSWHLYDPSLLPGTLEKVGKVDFPNLVQTVGVPVACLAALAFAVWRTLNWLGVHVVRPVAARHVKFLDELGLAMAAQSQAMQTLAIQQTKYAEQIERMASKQDEFTNRQYEFAKVLNRVVDILDDGVLLGSILEKRAVRHPDAPAATEGKPVQ